MTSTANLTDNQKLIISLIIAHRNDYVGWNENSYSDTDKTWSQAPSIKECEDYIYDEIMNSKEKYQITEYGLAIETKHIRFEGSEWIRSMIHERVMHSYNKGWYFPHAKEQQ